MEARKRGAVHFIEHLGIGAVDLFPGCNLSSQIKGFEQFETNLHVFIHGHVSRGAI